MKDPAILSHDPLTGATTYGHAMPDDRLVIQTVRDVEPVLEYCKRQRNEGVKSVLGRETREIAAIPMEVLDGMKALFGLDWTNKAHRPAIMNHVKFGDFKQFLTTDARLKRS